MDIAEPTTLEQADTNQGEGWRHIFWNRLTEPAESVVTREGRRQARLLSSVLLAFTLLMAASIISILMSASAQGTMLYVQLSLAGLFALTYRISRTRRYTLAAVVTVGAVAILPLAAYVTRGDYSYVATANTLIWTVIALLVGNVFFSTGGMTILTLFLVASLGMLPLIKPGITYQNLYLVMALDIIAGAIALISRRHRDLAERDHRFELFEANHQSQTLSLLLEGRIDDQARDLSLAAEVGRTISQVRDLNSLLAEAVELICARFDLYHVQVYLANDTESSLALQSGTGTVGKRLIAQGHRLQFGPGSINGLAAGSRQSVVVADTANSPLFRPNALLPETRSEMAIPLIIGSRVLGVLDLQSSEPNGLTDEDLPTFEALAGQLAVAIENARLFTEINMARAELETRTADQAYAAWHDFMDAIHRRTWIGYGYVHDENVTRPLAEPFPTVADELCLATPITVRGEPVGAIHLEREPSEVWSHQAVEIVTLVARQVAQKVENLRLLAEAEQYRKEAEGAARRLTREGWESYLDSIPDGQLGFAYDHTEVVPISAATDAEPELAIIKDLSVGNETIGHLSVEHLADDKIEATELVATVAERLSAHIENLRLSEQTEQALATSKRHASRLAMLNELSEALNRAPSLVDVFQVGTNYVGQILAPDRVSLTMIMPPGTDVEIVAIYGEKGDTEVGQRLPIEEGSTFDQVIQTKHLINVPDSVSSGLGRIRSFVMAPLLGEEGVIGTVNIGSKVSNAYNRSDENLILQIAAILGSSIERRQLSERMGKRAAEMETVARLSSATANALETGSLLQDVVDLTKSSFDLYHVHIYLLDKTQTSLVLSAGAGEVGMQMVADGRSIPLEQVQSLVARAARNRQAVVTNDVQAEPDFLPHPLLPKTRSEMAVPLVSGDHVLGVLDVQAEEAHRFTSEDVHIQTTLAAQVAVAIQRARLLEDTRGRARHEQALREITARVSRSASVDSVMRTAVEELGRALGRRAFVYLGDPKKRAAAETKNGANYVYRK